MSTPAPSSPETPTLKPTLPPDESGWGKFVAGVLLMAGLVIVVKWLFSEEDKGAKNVTPSAPPAPGPPPSTAPVPLPPPEVIHIHHHHHPPSEPPSPEERQIMLSIWQWKRLKVILAVISSVVALTGTIAGLIIENA